jgi:probable rRNA maturation factor
MNGPGRAASGRAAELGVEVFVADEQAEFPVEHLRWLHLAEGVLGEEGVRGDAELSILFVDEATMTDLNLRFTGKEGPTDVLSFPIDEEPTEGGRSPDSGGSGPGYTPPEPSDLPILIGDVVVCPAVATRNAPEHAGTYTDEIALLIVHGILHLMGMDHEEDDEAELMEARERELLAKFHQA